MDNSDARETTLDRILKPLLKKQIFLLGLQNNVTNFGQMEHDYELATCR